MKREFYWLCSTFLTAVLITGLACDFNFFNFIEVPFNSGHYKVLPVYFALCVWTILIFIVFLVFGFRRKFTTSGDIWLMLVASLLLSLLILFVTYVELAGSSIAGLFEMFGFKIARSISDELMFPILYLLIVVFVVGDFLLVRRLVVLKRGRIHTIQ